MDSTLESLASAVGAERSELELALVDYDPVVAVRAGRIRHEPKSTPWRV